MNPDQIIHGKKLLSIFPMCKETDPVKLYKALRRLEVAITRINKQWYNGEISTEGWESQTTKIQLKVVALLGTKEGIFISTDPMGYALKIESEYVRKHNLNIHRDWGGYGILAPDLARKPQKGEIMKFTKEEVLEQADKIMKTGESTPVYEAWKNLVDEWFANDDGEYLKNGFKGWNERSPEEILMDFHLNNLLSEPLEESEFNRLLDEPTDITATLVLNLTEKELEALYTDCKINITSKYVVDGVNLHPVFQQIVDEITRNLNESHGH